MGVGTMKMVAATKVEVGGMDAGTMLLPTLVCQSARVPESQRAREPECQSAREPTLCLLPAALLIKTPPPA